MLRRAALVRTDVSEELSASIIRVTIIGEPGMLVTTNVPSSPIFVTLMMEVLSSSEKSVLKRAARHNIQEDSILETIIIFNSRQHCNVYINPPNPCQFVLG
jgi:hypothetical protein